MKDLNAESLHKKFQSGTCTPEEEALIEQHLKHVPIYEELSEDELELELDELDDRLYDIFPEEKKTNWPLLIVKMVAVLLLIATAATYFLKKDNPLPSDYANDVNPGTNKAVLILASGVSINLTDAKDGELAQDQSVKIIKTADGQLEFKFSPDAVKAATATKRDSISSLVTGTVATKVPSGLNSVTTPRGGQYHIALPDGTNVWINAGSTLKFPSSFFDMPERRVHLTGEAYFEVAQVKSVFGMQKRARKVPFIVQTDKQEVTVLGTHFNINSYTDEPSIKTTLIEGLVKVSSFGGGDAILKPGMQAVNVGGSSLKVAKVDTDEIIAWKNGEFMFRNESLESIMRKVSRWYNVEVVYENKQVGKELFGGTISRYDKISKVLCALEGTGDVKFKVDFRKVTVSR